MTIGMAAMSAPATAMLLVSGVLVRPRRAIWIVAQSSVSVMTARGHRYWLQAVEERDHREGGDHRPGERHRELQRKAQCP